MKQLTSDQQAVLDRAREVMNMPAGGRDLMGLADRVGALQWQLENVLAMIDLATGVDR